MKLKPITPESEDRLLRAVSSAIGHHNGGMSASESLAKAAAAEGLNMDFTNRAIQAFNVAKSIRHFRENREDGEKRAASFDKADPESVFSSMFRDFPTETTVSKSASVQEGYIRDFATIDRADFPTMVKTAYEKPLGSLMDARIRIEKIVGEKSREVAAIKSAALQLTDKRSGDFRKLVDSFNISGSYAYSQFRKDAAERYGGVVEPLLKAIDCRVGRQGLTSRDYQSAKKAFDLFDKLLGTINAEFDTETKLTKASEELEEMQRKVAELREKPAAQRKEASPEEGGFFNDIMNKMLGTLPSNEATVKDTGFGDKIRAVESQAELAKLMSTDTVLKRYDPLEVQTMYNEIVRTAPNLATRPMALRSQLRKSMESAANPLGGANLDPFELGQMATTAKTLGQQTFPEAEGGSV